MYVHKNGITLKKLEQQDLPKLKELKNESWFGTHKVTFINLFEQEKWFNSLDSNKDIIFTASFGGDIIGIYKILNIDWVSRRYESGHDIFIESRGRGLSKLLVEAGVALGFEVLNMHRIDSEVLSNNIASIKALEYAGFLEEGIKKKSIYKCGEYLDSICMGILREDWISISKSKYGKFANESYTPKNGFNR